MSTNVPTMSTDSISSIINGENEEERCLSQLISFDAVSSRPSKISKKGETTEDATKERNKTMAHEVMDSVPRKRRSPKINAIRSPPASSGFPFAETPRIDCMSEKLPFEKRSPLWEMIDSMEVFKTMNQNPHFSPLSNSKEECREGLAIANMVTFANLVEKMGKLQFDDPRSIWVSYLEDFLDLEKHGFDVQVPRNRLNELLALKDRQIANKDELIKRALRLIEDVTQSIKTDRELEKLNEMISVVLEKRASIMSVKKIKESEIGMLQQRVNGLREGIRSNQLYFERARATPH